MSDTFDWIASLRGDEATRDATLEKLRATLLRGLSRSLSRRGGGEAFAEDVVQEALLKIVESLDTFSGSSKFTTWAMTIATRIGISKLRRAHFRNVSLEQIAGENDLSLEIVTDPGPTPGETSEREEVLGQLKQLIDSRLTDKQRRVVQAALSGMPMEEIAARMDSNRNAVYKLFHDAKKKLRSGFEEQGTTSRDIQAILS